MAAELIAATHSEILRLLANTTGIHFQGLGQAARTKSLCLPAKVRRHLTNLDVAHNLVRHITSVSAARLVEEVAQATSPHDEPPHQPPGIFWVGVPGHAEDGPPLVPAHTSPSMEHEVSEATIPDAPTAKRLQNKRISAPGGHTHHTSTLPLLETQETRGSREPTNLGHPRNEGRYVPDAHRRTSRSPSVSPSSSDSGVEDDPLAVIIIKDALSSSPYLPHPFLTSEAMDPDYILIARTLTGWKMHWFLKLGSQRSPFTGSGASLHTDSEDEEVPRTGALDGHREPPSSSFSSPIRSAPRDLHAPARQRGAPIRDDTYWIQMDSDAQDPAAPRRGRSRTP